VNFLRVLVYYLIDVKFAQISLRFEIYFVGATKLIVELAYFY
jgi:hypothetical protein